MDSTLTFWENSHHLRSMVRMLFSESLDTFELAYVGALQEQYMDEHFLSYYASCRIGGETKSEEVGDADTAPQRFSLKTMTETGFSLRTMIDRKR